MFASYANFTSILCRNLKQKRPWPRRDTNINFRNCYAVALIQGLVRWCKKGGGRKKRWERKREGRGFSCVDNSCDHWNCFRNFFHFFPTFYRIFFSLSPHRSGMIDNRYHVNSDVRLKFTIKEGWITLTVYRCLLPSDYVNVRKCANEQVTINVKAFSLYDKTNVKVRLRLQHN